MTITYTAEVATCRGFGCFLKLLFRWRGSIYKLVWLDLLAFLFIYYMLNLIYRFSLNPEQKLVFESIVQYCNKYSELIPLSFVLGFYVSIVMTRWWNQYTSIPWPDPIAVFISSNVHGQDERGRVMRRSIMRYVCLCLTMVLINVSPRVKKRFPNLSNLVEAGLLNENEKSIIESMNKSFPRHSKHWLPIVWAASIITRARKEGRIRDDFAVKTIIDELNKFRGQAGLLISYDTISIPLVYTQVVTLAVYSYFLCAVMGQQWTNGKVVTGEYLNKVDLYFPVFTTLQFFFYMGWLKVAESLINPFGDDDDDFEVNWMVDRNLQVSYLIVDEMHHDHPELIKDQYWDEVFPNELPYTIASERFRENHPEPSTAKIEVPKAAAMTSNLSSVRIDEMVGNNATSKAGDISSAAGASTGADGAVNAQGAQLQTVSYEFPKSAQEEEADDASGIHFTAGNGKLRPGSTPSLVSFTGTLSRVNTVASALKRLLSRDDSRAGLQTPSDEPGKYRFPGSASTASLTGMTAAKPAGSLRIADQVIEEVDEQTTITSYRGSDNPRPNVREIFAPTTSNTAANVVPQPNNGQPEPTTPRSDPMDIPSREPQYVRAQSQYEPSLFPPGGVEALLSTSAPAGGNSHLLPSATGGNMPSTPIGDSSKSLYERNSQKAASRETVEDMDMRTSNDVLTGDAAATAADDEGDDFEKLKAAREKERADRQKQMFARSISTAPGVDPTTPGTATIVPMALIQQPVAVAAQALAPTAAAVNAQVQPSIPTVPSSAELLTSTGESVPDNNIPKKSEDVTNVS